jgi:hypothetical protein
VPEAQAKPEWLENWEQDPRSRVPQKVGNPNWYKGMPRSPNPKGRPAGSSKQQKLMQRMLDDAGEVVDAVLAKAKEGDPASVNIVLSRIMPALRSQSEKVVFDFDASLPISQQIEMVLNGIASGAVSADTGKLIIEAVQSLSAVRATEELEQRIILLEAKALPA